MASPLFYDPHSKTHTPTCCYADGKFLLLQHQRIYYVTSYFKVAEVNWKMIDLRKTTLMLQKIFLPDTGRDLPNLLSEVSSLPVASEAFLQLK